MYVHTRERDIRPGFDGVKIKLYYCYYYYYSRQEYIYYTVTNCSYIFDAFLGVQCANKNFKYLAFEATLERC